MTSHLDKQPAKHPDTRAKRPGVGQRTGDNKSHRVPKRQGRNSIHKVIGGLAALVLLAACSDGSDSTASDNAAVPTIKLTTTTTERTTTVPIAEPTSSTTEDPRPAIEAAFEGYTQYLPTHGATVVEVALADLMADPLLTRYTERLREYEDLGIVVGNDLHQTHIISVFVENGQATIESCDLDAISLLSEAGEEYVPADVVRFRNTTQARLFPQGWRIVNAEFTDGVQTICDL